MKVTTQPITEVYQEEYDRHKNGETIRDPIISLYFLQPFNTIRQMVAGRPEIRIIHCPSDDESLFYRKDPKEKV